MATIIRYYANMLIICLKIYTKKDKQLLKSGNKKQNKFIHDSRGNKIISKSNNPFSYNVPSRKYPWFYIYSDIKQPGYKRYGGKREQYRKSLSCDEALGYIKKIGDDINMVESELNEFANVMTLTIGNKNNKPKVSCCEIL